MPENDALEADSPRGGVDELRDLAWTFRQTVRRLALLVGELDLAHQRALQAEVEKKRFYREVVRAVTRGKFELVDREEMPARGPLVRALPAQEYLGARQAITEIAGAAGMTEDRASELVLAAGEAITNALKHGKNGRCEIYQGADGVVVRITDEGGGIPSLQLPATILLPGFSTGVSLGMGYTIMLQLSDRVWLATGPEGTSVQLEKRIQPPEQPHPGLSTAWERL